ncbi:MULTISPECIES: hypothetical protein [Sporomusaceae]|uniref:hypothetical protein n=1 Tax=Sporomusaceae TaxID=1843490 RepID=UPI0003654B5D|nr:MULTISPECIES: hypothetical protein [Sporomusaceae]
MEETEIQVLLHQFSQSSNALKKVTKRIIALQTLAQELQDAASAFEEEQPMEAVVEHLEKQLGSFVSVQSELKSLRQDQEELQGQMRLLEERVEALSRGQEELHQDVKECKSLLQESLAVQRAFLDRLPPAAEEEE